MTYGAALERLARAYESDADRRLDLQEILLYLEGMDAASIGEIAGISPGNVATKIHRVKKMLARRFHKGTS